MLVIEGMLLLVIIWLSIIVYKDEEREEERIETRRRQKRQALENEWRDYEEYMNIKNAVMFYESAKYGPLEYQKGVDMYG